jgi:hypothetical protein
MRGSLADIIFNKRFVRVFDMVCIASGLVLASACGGSSGSSTDNPSDHPMHDAGGHFFNSDQAVSSDASVAIAHERGDASTAEPTCGSSPFGAAPEQVNMLLVIDKSGSMSDTPQDFDSDKWSAMKKSVAAALTPMAKQIRLGLELYPIAGCDLPSGGGVDVEVQAGDKALPLATKALADAEPSGGTPTAAALARALEYFTTGAGKNLDGGKYVLLATDGGPNCNDTLSCDADACTVNLDGQCPMSVSNCCDEKVAGSGAQSGCLDDSETLDRIRALHDAGVDTFVVGIPGSEAYADALDAFAKAGGRPNQSGSRSYFQVSASGGAETGLTTVLETIASGLIKSCRLQLGSTPPALDQLNVEIDGVAVPQQGADGWALDTTTTPPTIELKGETCKHVENDGAQSVSVTFGCPTLVVD